MSARFRIKVARHATRNPIKLADRERPAFVGQYPTLERACLAMDNIVRNELGFAARLPISTTEVQAAMQKRAANLVDGKVPHAAPVRAWVGPKWRFVNEYGETVR